MVTIITNYTTYDQAYYYADLQRVVPLSEAARAQLLATSLSTGPTAEQARQRLIESYLHLVKHLAIEACPPHCYQHLFADLIGEANRALVEVLHRPHLAHAGDLTSYVVAWVRGKLKGALSRDRFIRVPWRAIQRAKQRGTEQQLYARQPESLDALMEWFETDEVEEPPTVPLLPTEPAPPRDPVLRAQVEGWLSSLSPREQAVIRLRYGLADENERAHGTTEIAHLLGLTRKTVLNTERAAMLRLKALATGTATISERCGQPRVTGIYQHHPIYQYHPPRLSTEEETRLRQAAQRLAGQGIVVSARRLGEAAGIAAYRAQAFLHAHRDEFPAPNHAELQQARWQRLEEAHRRLLAQGIAPTHQRLAQETHVSHNTIAAFLRAQQGGGNQKQDQQARAKEREEQLEQTYAALLEQGVTPTYERLAQAVHTSYSIVAAFLKSKQGAASHAAA